MNLTPEEVRAYRAAYLRDPIRKTEEKLRIGAELGAVRSERERLEREYREGWRPAPAPSPTRRSATSAPSCDAAVFGLRGATVCPYGVETYIGLAPGVGFVEEFAVGAFDHLLRGDVVACAGHDEKHHLLARTGNQSLRLWSDGSGLRADADFAPTSYARDLVTLMDSGTVTQMSFAFGSNSDGEEHSQVERQVGGRRVVLPKVVVRRASALSDVSPVTRGAYGSATSVGRRLLG